MTNTAYLIEDLPTMLLAIEAFTTSTGFEAFTNTAAAGRFEDACDDAGVAIDRYGRVTFPGDIDLEAIADLIDAIGDEN